MIDTRLTERKMKTSAESKAMARMKRNEGNANLCNIRKNAEGSAIEHITVHVAADKEIQRLPCEDEEAPMRAADGAHAFVARKYSGSCEGHRNDFRATSTKLIVHSEEGSDV